MRVQGIGYTVRDIGYTVQGIDYTVQGIGYPVPVSYTHLTLPTKVNV